MVTTISIVAALLALTTTHGLHNAELKPPLRGYHCKDDSQTDAHEPCVLCPEGFYCPDKATMIKCGSIDLFCPLGSVLPTPVSQGFYTIDEAGPTDTRSAQQECDIGHYCDGGEMLICPSGHYCNVKGLWKPKQCGDSTVFCREGSVEPQPVANGYFSINGSSNATREDQSIAPKGHFAKDGILFECPSGHFGNTTGLSTDDCSGICEAGWYCPKASLHSRQVACGGEQNICPEGSSSPQAVRDGYYTTIFNEEPCGPGKFRVPIPEEEVGISSVTTKLSKDSCIACPPGTHKPVSGDSVSLCLDCGARAYTTDGIKCECYQSATDKKKSTKTFYDWTSGICVEITNEAMLLRDYPDNYHEQGSQVTKVEEHPCEVGHFCEKGIRYKCAGGTFGDTEMEVNSDCSGICKAGFYCPEASTSPTQHSCGSADVYCPPKSSSPTYVSPGYYSNESDPDDQKTSQHLCPPGFYCPGDGLRYKCKAGRYGSSSGLTDEACDGECKSGYACESGSTSPLQSPCGNATVYCPKASSVPILVDPGYYSASEIYSITANYAGPNATHDIQRECEVGYWCQDGIKFYCPQGTYGVEAGSTNVDQCRTCEEGFYCKSQPAKPTTKQTQVECGDASKYCPRGSAEPRDVDLGYYTLNRFGKEEGLETQRTSQVECPPGFFCQIGLKFKCKEGTYGDKSALFDENCSGFCPRGFFCPENTVHPIPCSPGSYASGGAKECTSCDVPLTVPMEVTNSLCRNDRSCCFDYDTN